VARYPRAGPPTTVTRTVQEVRNLSPAMAAAWAPLVVVAWLFENKGYHHVKGEGRTGRYCSHCYDPVRMTLKSKKDYLEIYVKLEDMEKAGLALKEKNVPVEQLL